MKRLTVLAPLVLTVAVVAAGCGGSDSGPAPTQAEYITQADAICKAANDEIVAVAQDQFGSAQPTQQELATFASDTVVPNLQGQLDDLGALTPPEGDSETTSEIYASLEEAISALEADPVGALNNNPDLERATQLASEYGLVTCGAS